MLINNTKLKLTEKEINTIIIYLNQTNQLVLMNYKKRFGVINLI